MPDVAAQQRVDSREQNRQLERLRQVVVCARGKSAQDVFGAAARRQHQDRGEPASRAHLGCHAEAVDAGQHHVEHHQIDAARVGRHEIQRRFAGVRDDHVVAVRLEVEPQPRGDVRLVFDDDEFGHRLA